MTNCKQHVKVQTRAVRQTKKNRGGEATEYRDREDTKTGRGSERRQPERVTECSPGRESVWVNVRAVLANSSVNLNL